MVQQNKNKLGVKGEAQAVSFLLKNKYKILAQNFKYKKFEIDIIALDQTKNELVFIEVKTRSSFIYGDPALAVSSKQMMNLQAASQVYLTQNKLEKNFRFDIITILPNQLKHFKNVTVE